jgi:hypothetical protein
MPNALDRIVEGFPHPIIQPINGIPNYEAIAELNLQLNANAASVQSNVGNGQLGLLALTASPAVYHTLSDIEFIPPANPGTTPNIPAGTTAAMTTTIIRQHITYLELFQEYLATDNTLKQQIIMCINSIYLCTLSLHITGFANVTTRQLLTHVYATYGRLSPSDLPANDQQMKNNYDPSNPLKPSLTRLKTELH